MNIALSFARLLLSVVFAVAGIAKLADLAGSRKSVLDFGVPALLAWPVAVLLPAAELVCAVALLPAASAWWGAIGTLALLLVFIAGISVSLARGRKPDCHCFGQLHSAPIGWTTLVRNGFLSGLAALAIWQGPKYPAAGVLDWLSDLSPLASAVLALSVALAAVAVLALWSLFHLLRQNGRLLLRVEALEAKIGISVPEAAPQPGLPVNSPAPAFSLMALDDGTVTLDALQDSGRPLLLVFTEPGCGACDSLAPDLARWQREYADRLSIVPISRGDAAENRAKNAAHNLQGVLLQADRETATAYQVEATPSAVLVRDGKIASPSATGTDAIRELVAQATVRTVKKGESVPALALSDLNGKSIDLAQLRGRRTLLLFWNPSCGFCQEMLPEVKAWERNRPEGAPDLLVISSGSPEDNRAQGFRSLVLLDHGFLAGQTFGSQGTPSAVMLDADGMVASDVRVGAPAVLELAGVVAPGEVAAA